jgi:hypothetical protein
MGQDEEFFLAKSRPSPYLSEVLRIYLLLQSELRKKVSAVIEVNKLPDSPNRSAPPELTSACTSTTRTCASRAHSTKEEGRLGVLMG